MPPGAGGSILHWQRTLGNQAVQRHLRTRTANVDGVPPEIQLSSLRDLTGTPRRPAFLIEEDEIKATDEFKKYMNSRDKMTRQEAFLACRLIIEAIQRREPFKWETDARAFMNSARKLFGITKSPKADCPSSKYKACVKRAELPDGLLGMTALPGLLSGDFTMEVDWHEDEPKCACCCGEYRQFVKGFVKIDGKLQTKKLLNGKELSDKVFTEDSDAQNHPYGYRGSSDKVNDRFHPDRPNGCLYRGFDTPGINDPGVAGKRVEVQLEFKGQTFDRCQKTAGPEKHWKMEFNDDVPGGGKGGTGVG